MASSSRNASFPALSTDIVKDPLPSGARDLAPILGADMTVLYKHLDASRVQVLVRLFDIPGQQGIDVFTRLLTCALITPEETSSSPAVETRGKFAALLSVESLHVLSKLIKRSYETTQKYVTLFCTCGLIERQKIKHSRRVYLAFPASLYLPPPTLLADLDALLARQAKRPKVKSLTRQVRDRCIAYAYVTGEALGLEEEDMTGSLQHVLTVLQSADESTSRITKAVTLLTNLLSATQTARLQGKNKDSRSFKGDASVVDMTSPRFRRLGDSSQKPVTTISLPLSSVCDASTSKGDASQSRQEILTPSAKESTTQVDARPGVPTSIGRESPSLVDATTSTHSNQVVTSTTQVDARQVAPAVPVLKSVESPGKGDISRSRQETPCPTTKESTTQVDANSSEHEKMGDSAQHMVDSCDPANVNVITIINNITLNVKLVAMFCCRALGEPPQKWPIYRKLFQSPEVEQDTQAIIAALLFTLAHRDDGSMRNPASVFIQRCKDFHKAAPPSPNVFAEAMDLVERYGHLTYQQLTQQLSAQRAQTTQVQVWQPEPHTTPTYQTPSSLQPIASGSTRDLKVLLPLRPGGGMTWESAQRLREQIAHDIRFGRCRVAPVTLKDGSYGILVDKTEEQKVRQYVLYAEQEWQQRSLTLKSCYELFDGEAPQGLSLLKKALKKNE